MRIKVCFVFGVCLFLGGCSVFDTKRSFQPDPIPKDSSIPSDVEIFRAASEAWWNKNASPQPLAGDAAKEYEQKKAIPQAELNQKQKGLEENAKKRKEIVQSAADDAKPKIEELNKQDKELTDQIKNLRAQLKVLEEDAGGTNQKYGERSDVPTPDKRRFLDAGLNLSDALADRWLKGEYSKDTSSRYWKNTFNVAASLTTAALGFTGAGGKAVTAVGASAAAVNAQWNNYEASYLLSSAMPKVIEKLKKFRADLRKEIETKFDAGNFTYLQTRDIIDKYHDSISRERVKNFIDSAVDLVDATYKPPGQEIIQAPLVAALNRQLYKAVYGSYGEFSMEDLTALFLLSKDRDTELKDTSAAGKSLHEAYDKITDTAAKNEVNRLLGQLGSSLSLEAKSQVRAKKLTAPAGTTGNTPAPASPNEKIGFQPAFTPK